MKSIYLLCILAAALPVLAQEKKSELPVDVKTSVRPSELRPGSITIYGEEFVGSLIARDKNAGQVVVECCESLDVISQKKEYAVRIKVVRFEPFESVSVDCGLDEVDLLLKGIGSVAGIQKEVSKLARVVAVYRSQSGLLVTKHLTTEQVLLAVSSGQVTVVLPVDGLVKLKALLEQAKAKLDSMRSS